MGGFVPQVFKLNREAPESFLFVKQNKQKHSDGNIPSDRTLFVLNVPPCADAESIKELFSSCGSIENVYLNRKPTVSGENESSLKFFKDRDSFQGPKVCYIVFKNSSGRENALRLNACKSSVLFTDDKKVPPLTQLFSHKYSSGIVDPEEMKKTINNFMADYDKKLELEKQKVKEMDGVPDDEGWITVTKHSKIPVAPRTDTTNPKIIAKQKKRSQKTLINLYGSQMKESKMGQLAAFQKRYEEQREKIEKMKLSRKFRPY